MPENKVSLTYEDNKKAEFLLMDATEEPFELYGFGKNLRRLPLEVTEASNPDMSRQGRMPAGARIRFKTDSRQVILNLGVKDCVYSYSADIYEYKNGSYKYRAPLEITPTDCGTPILKGYDYFWPEETEMREYVVFLPFNLQVEKLEIGICEGSKVEKPSRYKHDLPILVYGSSIVHGEKALRNSSVYTNILSRMFDSDVINLGFGANAHAEIPMMEYIADQKMSIFIYDYDHNARTVDFLNETHYRGYEIFRKKQPDTPVIMASRVDYHKNPADGDLRRAVILGSYAKGLADGDRNLYFVDGKDIYGDYPQEYSYDGTHPNDAGYMQMAQAFAKVIKGLL